MSFDEFGYKILLVLPITYAEPFQSVLPAGEVSWDYGAL
jgi:hypothetical protein